MNKFVLKIKVKMSGYFTSLRRVGDEILIVIFFTFNRFNQCGDISFSFYRKLNLPIWYHDFSALGIKTRRFRGAGYDLSQQDKETILFKFIERASEIVKGRNIGSNVPISLVDLFCADAYYSLYAMHRGFVDSVVGVDFEEGSGEGFIRNGVLDQADTISRICEMQGKIELNKYDVLEYKGDFDICLCIGGLYHISDPIALLRKVTAQTRHVLVIQTVIPSHVSDDSTFFVTPAPHWTWGSRFNKKHLTDALKRMGWTVAAMDVREMRANIHEWDKLSLSLLCVKDSFEINVESSTISS